MNLSARLDGRSVDLDWDPPLDDGNFYTWYYRVYRGTSVKNLSEVAEVHPLFTRWNGTLPEDGVTFYFGVTAVSPGGESALLDLVNVTNATKPGPPSDLRVQAGCGTVTLNWTAPTRTGGIPIIGYHVHRGTDPLELDHLTTVTDEVSFTDEGLVNGVRYHYSVSANNSMGNSTPTPVISALPVGPPPAPRGLDVIMGDGEISLRWRHPISDGGSAIVGYRILRGTDRGSLDTLAQVSWSTRSYIDTTVENGVIYYYAVQAINGYGNGTLSPIVSQMPVGPPGAPVNLTGHVGVAEVTISWEPPGSDGGSDLTRYMLFKGASREDLKHVTSISSDKTSYTDRDLEYGGTIFYAISASNDIGSGPLSDVISISPEKLPEPPEDLRATGGRESVSLMWRAPIDTGGVAITGFVIYRGTFADGLSAYDSVLGGNVSYIDMHAADIVVYYYKVATVTTVGEGRLGNLVSAIPFTYPSEPTDLTLSPIGTSVELSWFPPIDLGGADLLLYRIYRGTDPELMDLYSEVAEGTTFLDGNLAPDLVYFYHVTAVTRAGEGPPSDVTSSDPSMQMVPPGPVRDLRADPKDGKVKLSWLPPTDPGGSPVTGYVIYRWTSDADLVDDWEVGDINRYKDDPPQKDMTYHYAVSAKSDDGVGEISLPVDVHVVAVDPSASPSTTIILLVIFVIILIVIGAIVWGVESVKYSLILLLLPLFTRFTREKIMDNKNRHAIHGLIIDNPGIHFNGIMKEYDIPAGVATYHLDVLERENFIKSLRDGRLKRFYSTHAKVHNGKLRKTPEEVRVALIELVRENPGISQMELIQGLGIERKTVSYHLAVLVKEDLLETKKMGRYTIYQVNGSN